MHLKVHLHFKHLPYIASYINMIVSKKVDDTVKGDEYEFKSF